MTNKLKFRYVYGIEGQPETYFFRYFTIEEIELGKSYIPLPEYKIISRDQFTGLKDKNGKKIYENDLLDFYEREWGGRFEPEKVPKITDLVGDWPLCGLPSDLTDWRAVIGNIYGISTKNDNPNPN